MFGFYTEPAVISIIPSCYFAFRVGLLPLGLFSWIPAVELLSVALVPCRHRTREASTEYIVVAVVRCGVSMGRVEMR
jgi:hypothetical protein